MNDRAELVSDGSFQFDFPHPGDCVCFFLGCANMGILAFQQGHGSNYLARSVIGPRQDGDFSQT